MSQYQSEEQQQEPVDIPGLRAAADRGVKAQQERDAALREIAFLRAGIDTESKVGQMFVKAYDGDLDPEKIRAEWSEVAPASGGNTPPPTEPPPPSATEQQLEETQARRLLTSAGAGDTPNEQPSPDPVAAGYDEYRERLGKGERRETAAGSVFSKLIEAANAGDERAIWTGWTPEELRQ